MVISQGDIWWVEFDAPEGSEAGFRRPVVVVQGDTLNRSQIRTVVCVPLTSNLKWATAPGNVLLLSSATGLPKDSVAQVALILAIDRRFLEEREGRLTQRQLTLILNGIDVILGR